MALVECVDCGQSVSDRASACPGCGGPMGESAAADQTPPPMPAARPAPAGGEQTLFNDFGVRVTTARFITSGKTFAMSGVTSVGISETPPSSGGLLLMILVTLFMGLVSLSLGALEAWAITVVCAVIAVAIALSMKTRYHVALHTAGGEVKALTSTEHAQIASIVEALNRAIVERG